MPFLALVALLILGAQPGTGLSAQDLSLPDAVHVEVVNVPAKGDPFDRMVIDESLTWLSGRQDLFEGSAGWLANDLTFSDAEQTITYNARARRGQRTDRFATTGTTRLDGWATPLCWVRMASFTEAHGGKVVTEAQSNGTILVRVTPSDRYQSAFVCVIDPARHELKEVRQGEGKFLSSYSYTDWQPIGTGQHLPHAIEFYSAGGTSGREFRKTMRVESAILRQSAPPTPLVFPSTAVVEDKTTGKVFYGDGREVPLTPKDNQAAALSPEWLNRNNLLIAGGVALVVAAALVFRKKAGV